MVFIKVTDYLSIRESALMSYKKLHTGKFNGDNQFSPVYHGCFMCRDKEYILEFKNEKDLETWYQNVEEGATDWRPYTENVKIVKS